jgi:hypothetical protein
MKKCILVSLLMVFLAGCGTKRSPGAPPGTATSLPIQPILIEAKPDWSVYDPDPEHPWNRVFRQLYRRSADGEEYGADELDPLLWLDTSHLLAGASHREVVQVLDEFLAGDADNLIRDPLKRAMFQRDLWAVFDWAASQPEPHSGAREALQARLAEIMKRVALSREEILSLPDNYALVVRSKSYPAGFQEEHPEQAFLPPDLLDPGSAWAIVGHEGGPAAMTHTESFPFFGRSVFLVFVRSPQGRAGTLEFIESLTTEAGPVTPTGTEVALVRRMLLIDDQGDLVLSPLVETVQIRHFRPLQVFHELELDRKRLFEGSAGGLVPNSSLFMLFMGHGDVFQVSEMPTLQASIPAICKACHSDEPYNFDSGNTGSIITYSRRPFPLADDERPVLFATTVMDEAQTVMQWKRDHETWKGLEALWR